jgi:hypothetical protein
MVDNGDDRDIGGGFNPAGLRRNMETGEMYDPGTVSNQAVAAPVASKAPVRAAPVAAPAAARAAAPSDASETPEVSDAYPDESRRGRMASVQEKAYVPFAPERGSLRGPSAAQLQEYEASRYPDESLRGKMASAQEKAYVPFAPERGSLRGPSAAQLQEYEASRGRTASAQKGAAPRKASAAASAVDQIPKDSSLYRNVTGGAPVTGSELSRNVGNTLSALTPLGGGFGKAGAELMTAKGAAERAAKARELAEAARRAKPATTLKSSASTAPARANQAAKSGRKKFNEDEEGVIFKRGGSTKKMASGGMTVSKASSRADGIAQRGKTRGKIC